jgi:hypothetical protein
VYTTTKPSRSASSDRRVVRSCSVASAYSRASTAREVVARNPRAVREAHAALAAAHGQRSAALTAGTAPLSHPGDGAAAKLGVTSSSSGGGGVSGPDGDPPVPPAPTSMGVPLPVVDAGSLTERAAAPGVSAASTDGVGFSTDAPLVPALSGTRAPERSRMT